MSQLRAYSIPVDFRRRQDIRSQFSPRKRLQKDLSFDHADTRGIKRLQRLLKVEAEVRSADAVVRTMRG